MPVLKIPRRDGNAMIISFDHYFAEGRKPESRQDFDRVCLMGALLMVGDALVSQVVQNDVFKSAPLPSWVGRSGPDGPVKIDDAEH